MQIGISADVPALGHGLATVLEEGQYRVVMPPDLADWLAGAEDPVVVLALEGTRLDVVVDLRDRRPDAVLVVLVPDGDETAQLEALQAGAAAVGNWGVRPDALLRLVEAAAADLTVLPSNLAHRLAAAVETDRPKLNLSHRDIEWLRALAGGSTVAGLAGRNAYSEREMYRLLHDLYERMGVEGRMQALVLATRYGLLD